MKKLLIFALLFLIPLMSFATTVDISSLSQDQQQAILQEVKTATPNTQTITDTLSKWKDLGQGIGVALVSISQQMGIAVNEFIKTPVGKIAIVVLVYKVIGASLLHAISFLLGSIFFLILGTKLFFTSPKSKEVWEYKPYLWGMWNRKVLLSSVVDDDMRVVTYCLGGVSFLAAAILLINIT